MTALGSLRIGYSVVFVLYLASMVLVHVSCQGDTEGQHMTYICEGESETIQCVRLGRINIISASYGSTDYANHCDGICFGLFGWCDCASDVTDHVQELCNGKYTCQVSSNNDVFDDPCPSRSKVLILAYSCTYVTSAPTLTTKERPAQPSTTVTTTKVSFTTAEPVKSTGSIIQPQTTVDTKPQTTVKTTEGFTQEDRTSGLTVEGTTLLRGDSGALEDHGSPGGTVIMAIVGASVVAFILILGVAGFILWKRRKRPDSTESLTNTHIYDEVTMSTNIQLTSTGATYRTDGNCNPADPANIADLYAKPNKKKSAPNVDQLYAKPIKKKDNDLNVDQMYAKPHKTTGGSNGPCNSGLNNEEEGYVDNMLYESTGTITFTTTGNEEGYVDNELYGSTA